MLTKIHENSMVLHTHTHTHTCSKLNNTKNIDFTKIVRNGKIDSG